MTLQVEDTSRLTKQTELWQALSDEDKKLPVLSFSQLQVMDRCEYRWYMGYGLGYTTETVSRALNVGGLTHRALERYYLLRRDDGIHPQDFLEGPFHTMVQGWLQSGHPEAVQHAGAAAFVMGRYLSECSEYDHGHKILFVEHHFLIKIHSWKGRPFLLQGYVDLVTMDRSGRVWLWDHKTGQKFWTKSEIDMDPQLPLYAVALAEEGIDAYGTIINMLNTYDYKDKSKVKNEQLFKRDQQPRGEEYLTGVAKNMLKMVDKTLEARQGQWRDEEPVRSLRKDCGKFCDFREACDLSLRGIPVEVVLNDSFKKKEKAAVPSSIQVKGVSS